MFNIHPSLLICAALAKSEDEKKEQKRLEPFVRIATALERIANSLDDRK